MCIYTTRKETKKPRTTPPTDDDTCNDQLHKQYGCVRTAGERHDGPRDDRDDVDAVERALAADLIQQIAGQ